MSLGPDTSILFVERAMRAGLTEVRPPTHFHVRRTSMRGRYRTPACVLYFVSKLQVAARVNVWLNSCGTAKQSEISIALNCRKLALRKTVCENFALWYSCTAWNHRKMVSPIKVQSVPIKLSHFGFRKEDDRRLQCTDCTT